jgi:hypothetical protein
MLVLAASAVHSGGANSSAVIFFVTAIAIAAFWRALIKIGFAVLILGFLMAIFAGGSALITGLHAIIP